MPVKYNQILINNDYLFSGHNGVQKSTLGHIEGQLFRSVTLTLKLRVRTAIKCLRPSRRQARQAVYFAIRCVLICDGSIL